jgi:hypothetical protein
MLPRDQSPVGMLQVLRPTDAPLRRPAPPTLRSIVVTTLVVLAVVSVAAIAAHPGV